MMAITFAFVPPSIVIVLPRAPSPLQKIDNIVDQGEAGFATYRWKGDKPVEDFYCTLTTDPSHGPSNLFHCKARDRHRQYLSAGDERVQLDELVFCVPACAGRTDGAKCWTPHRR